MKSTKKTQSKASNLFAALTILICLIIGYIIWSEVMGHPSNFEGGDNTGHPLPGNFLGQIYKGGIIVPVLLGLMLTAIVFSIERFFVLNRASGKGSLDKFIIKVKTAVNEGDIEEAKALCDKQKGSPANAIKAALIKYQEVRAEGFDSEKAAEMISTEIEEATSLEMPVLQKHMTILATLVSIGTLIGLLGTVTGMIKAFSALATAGTPDQAQLANGISEALINTATGIATSTVATIAYNYFNSKIDDLTFFIDEAGFAITQSYRKLKADKK